MGIGILVKKSSLSLRAWLIGCLKSSEDDASFSFHFPIFFLNSSTQLICLFYGGSDKKGTPKIYF